MQAIRVPLRVRGSTTAILVLVALALGLAVVVWMRMQGSQPPLTTAPGSEQPPRPQTAASPGVAPSPIDLQQASAHQLVKFRPTGGVRHLQLLDYPHFTVGYDNDRKNPAWVLYELDGPITAVGAEPTRPIFGTEFRTSAHVSNSDYTNSGFDRGHLCPAYALFSRYGAEGFRETFVMANVIPQPHGVNAGIWEDLEANIAGRAGRGGGWAESLRHLTIINGPVYGVVGTTPALLKSGVMVPEKCFSVILDEQEDGSGYNAIAFEIPNQGSPGGPLKRWLTSIQKIERDTGLNLLTGMDPEERDRIATRTADTVWPGLNP